MIETVKRLFSIPLVMVIIFLRLILFFKTGVESNPHNIIAHPTTAIKNWTHDTHFFLIFRILDCGIFY